jgi:Transposase DDE domain
LEAPTRDLMARMPLAEAVLTLWRWVADADSLDQIFDRNRGRCYEKVLSFSFLVYLIRDALLEFNGSGRRTMEKAEERGQLETSFRAVYGKLERLPIAVSTALLAGCTARLRALYPEADEARTPLPQSLAGYRIEIIDGKAIKRVAKRLKPLWGLAGGVLGGRALVAMDLRSGLATAMVAHPDGDANDAKFVAELVPEVRRLAPGRRLWVGDRQYCDLTQPAIFAEQGDAFLVRYHPKVPFYADPARPACEGHDDRGRRYVEDWGWLGSPLRPKKRLYVRRIILSRPGEEDLILVTNLCDAGAVPAVDLLEVYLNRWGIERMFQQVVEVFGLSHLMGTTPEGTIGQFSLCLLLYNMIQVMRGVIAVETGRRREAISGEKLFEDVQREMIAWSVTIRPEETIDYFAGPLTAVQVEVRLSELLSDVWKDRWLKAPPRKRRSPPKRRKERTHSSVYRILEAHQLRLKKEKRGVAVA